jgi:uncharacterized protein
MPAKAVFIDTNGWLALLNSSDNLHPAARDLWAQLLDLEYSFVLTDWVIAETGNGLARTPARRSFPVAVELLRSSPRTQLVSVSGSLFQEALDLYARREDKTWGLVDCASFVLMREQGLHEALTNDHHFEQAGFHPLL